MPVCGDDRRHLVADELVVGDAHDLDSTAQLIRAESGNVLPFQDAAPTPAGDWRHIVRFGLNVASYKFALGQALLELAARQQAFVPLPELAVPYAACLCEHLQVEDRQSTARRSRFLDACRSRDRSDLEAAQLTEATVRLGFANVIDAFHISRGGQPTRPASSSTSGPAARHHADRPPAWCRWKWPRIKTPSTCTHPPGCAAAPSPVSGTR